jgi:hypothetical protein
MFAPGTVAYLAPKREDVFGMANACEKDLVVGRDMPAKLSASLPQELMQAMTSGDGMEIPRKGTTSLNVTWKAPVIMASNHMPDYVNSGNNVGRRLVTLHFTSVVTDPEEGLLEKILDAEMPQIIARCLGEYQALRALVKATKGGFWKAVPPKLLEWQGLLASATNKLHAFLSMEDDERGCNIERVEGHVTWLQDFKSAYEACMGHGTFVKDTATLHAFGFRMSEKKEHVCMACKQLAKTRGGNCCPAFSRENRRVKYVIHGMVCGAFSFSVTSTIKKLVDGSAICTKVKVEGKQYYNVYKGCGFKRAIEIGKGSKSEFNFRKAIEELTGLNFPSVRPPWLLNVTGKAMELDMYNEANSIAVEYDGPHHFVFPNAYQTSVEEFEAQTARDRLKDRLCVVNGVTLIRVRASILAQEIEYFKTAYDATMKM